MEILLVGDNRDQPNWGGRGQSIALYQMLDECSTNIEVITGREMSLDSDNDIFIRTFLPKQLFKIILENRTKLFLGNAIYKLERLLGAKDYVTENPAKSSALLVDNRSKHPGLSKIYKKIKKADVVVINGEGSGVFSTPFRRDFFFYLMIAELSIRMGKKTYFINSIISDCPITGRNKKSFEMAKNTLRKCNAVALRDLESYEIVKDEMSVANSYYIPDALFSWHKIYENCKFLPANGNCIIPFPDKQEYFNKLDFSKPYICIGGSSLAAHHPNEAYNYYIKFINKLKILGFPIYLTECCAGDRFLQKVAKEMNVGLIPVLSPIYMCGAVLANAKLFISGRFHATIFASLGGTPSIFLKAHSHKMKSLQQVLEYECIREFSEVPKGKEIGEIINIAEKYIKAGNSMRNKIKAVSKRLSDESEKIKELVSL
jgi:polysaccharide pyruvyl transferase WcaK-like protein